MKKIALYLLFYLPITAIYGQKLHTPPSGFNLKSSISQQIGITKVSISWDAPGVKGRDGKIWGTNVAPYGFSNPGFGTANAAPWRAGANENTTITFSTDVTVEGKPLAAGTYGFFIALYPDSCTLIFSKNSTSWGAFFYDPKEDALRLSVRQQKNLPASREWLGFEFSDQTDNSAVVALVWEHWRIPFRVAVDLPGTVVAAMREDLRSDPGFHADNWLSAAQFCLQQNYNLEEALGWVDNAANFGPVAFTNLQLKARIQERLGRTAEAQKTMAAALEMASVLEIHQYGRQLITEKKPQQAMEVFLLNQKKNGDAWPVHVGLARGYSATGDLKKALEHAQIAQKQAPDDINKKSLEGMVKTLSEGKPLMQ